MPFSDRTGLLVLSHTNAAIDEIKESIGDYCPKLFSYPNFVGTIQSFVNDFLAKPFYQSVYKSKLITIDDIQYNNTWDKIIYSMEDYDPLKMWLAKKYNPENFYHNIRFDTQKRLLKAINTDYSNFELKDQTKPVYARLRGIKASIMKKGILCYDDAYFFAESYLNKVPLISTLLCHRFKYVFVDEMQDMELHQYSLLEKLFAESGFTIYQRIGDKNQSIYGNTNAIQTEWADRETVLPITGSHRLTTDISKIVTPFAIAKNVEINGINNQENGNIKPHLLVFGDVQIKCTLIQKYVQLVKEFQDVGKIPTDDATIKRKPIAAVSWITQYKDDGKFRLPQFCPKYSKVETKPKKEYDNLSSYIKNHGSLKLIRKNILNALLKILRLCEKKDVNDRYYVENSLLKFLREEKFEEYEKLKEKLFKWSMGIIREVNVIDYIKEFIPSFITAVGTISNPDVSEFLIEPMVEETKQEVDEHSDDCINCKINGKKILIDSVHAVKGQTHTATLYIESFYDSYYESLVLPTVICKENTTDIIGKNRVEIAKILDKINNIKGQGKKRGIATKEKEIESIQSKIERINKYSKMLYVGFSRPTHFLCFAIHKAHFELLYNEAIKEKWEIIKLY